MFCFKIEILDPNSMSLIGASIWFQLKTYKVVDLNKNCNFFNKFYLHSSSYEKRAMIFVRWTNIYHRLYRLDSTPAMEYTALPPFQLAVGVL